MITLLHDIMYGFRILRKNPGYSLTIIVCMALGIGGVTAVLSVMNGVFLRLMPYEKPDRLVLFLSDSGDSDTPDTATSAKNYLDWKTQNKSFSEMAVYKYHRSHHPFRGWNDTEERLVGLNGLVVSPGFFDVLGVRPILGHALRKDRTSFDEQLVIILSHHVWCDLYGSDPNILGRCIKLDGHMCEVTGVMPPDYRFLPAATWTSVTPRRKIDYWIPIRRSFGNSHRGNWAFNVIARLKPGISLGQAQADMNVITEWLKEQYPDNFNEHYRVIVRPLSQILLGPVRSATFVLFVAAGFVLLIACANVVNLHIVNSMNRREEITIRSALGGSRLRIMQQLLVENMILIIAGGTFGVFLAIWGVDALIRTAPKNIPGLDQAGVDWRVFIAAILITLSCGFVVGLIPALSFSRLNLAEMLKKSGKRITQGFKERLAIRLNVVSEIALALVLLISAGLMIRTLWHIVHVDLGIQTSHILTARISGPNISQVHDRLLQHLRSIPGVTAAASNTALPLTGQPSDTCRISSISRHEGRIFSPTANLHTVSPDYFSILGIPLRQGRSFTSDDNENSAPVVIVNHSLARQLWPGENPIGQRVDFSQESTIFQSGTAKYLQREVIGVIGDIRYEGPDRKSTPASYLPFAQRTRDHFLTNIVLLCSVEPESLTISVRREIQETDSSCSIQNIKSMKGFYSDVTANRRFLMVLLSVFALVAFILSVVGIYGVIAFMVSMRMHEVGIRLTFGARGIDIMKLMLGYAVRLILSGLAVGILTALAMHKVIKSHLFGISPMDPLTLGISITLVVLVPLVAAYIPARRAAKVDPMAVLRYE